MLNNEGTTLQFKSLSKHFGRFTDSFIPRWRELIPSNKQADTYPGVSF